MSGAAECCVRVAYAPNLPEPLEAATEVLGEGESLPMAFFDSGAVGERYGAGAIGLKLACGRHFLDRAMPWNQASSRRCDLRQHLPERLGFQSVARTEQGLCVSVAFNLIDMVNP